jgi:hypothetical protein
VRVRAEYFALFRSAMLVDGVLRRLDPSVDPIAETRRFMMRNALSRRWFVPAAAMALQTTAGRAVRIVRARGLRLGLAASAVAALVAVALFLFAGESTGPLPAVGSPSPGLARENLTTDCPLNAAPRVGGAPRRVVPAGAVAEVRGEAGAYWRVRIDGGAEGYLAKACFPAATAR